jgi:hypothetical protein
MDENAAAMASMTGWGHGRVRLDLFDGTSYTTEFFESRLQLVKILIYIFSAL